MPQLTTAQAAQLLRVTTRSVHRMVADKRLVPVMKLPGDTGAYLFDEVDVERIRTQRQAERAEQAS